MSEVVNTQVEDASQIEAANAVAEQPKAPKSPEELAKIEEARERQRALVTAALLGHSPEKIAEAFRSKTLASLAGSIPVGVSDVRLKRANFIKVPENKAIMFAVPIEGGTAAHGYELVPNPAVDLKKPEVQTALKKAGYEGVDNNTLVEPAFVGIAGNTIITDQRARTAKTKQAA